MPYPKDNEIICFISANINQYCHNLEESNFFGDFLIRKKPTPNHNITIWSTYEAEFPYTTIIKHAKKK